MPWSSTRASTRDSVLGLLKDRGLVPAAILNTHGHADHIAGNAEVKLALRGGAADHRPE